MNAKYFYFLQKNKEFLVLGLVMFFILFFHFVNKEEPMEKVQDPTNPLGIDLLIPEGHTLIPIEVTNYETLDSLLGPYGVVDLFTVDSTSSPSQKKIASLVKILRAPKNPSHFAVLVPSSLAVNILKYSGPFTVSVRNPRSQKGMELENKPQRKRSRIVYN